MPLKHNTTWIIRFYLVGKLLLCLLKRTGKNPRKCGPRSVLGVALVLADAEDVLHMHVHVHDLLDDFHHLLEVVAGQDPFHCQ